VDVSQPSRNERRFRRAAAPHGAEGAPARGLRGHTPNRDALLAANPKSTARRVFSPTGYDASMFAPDSLPRHPDESADLTYVGEVYSGMMDRYCAAIASIRARNPAHVPRLAVYGTINASERRAIAALGLESFVEDRGFVSHEESVAAMKNARTLLVLLPAHERWRTCVPSKLSGIWPRGVDHRDPPRGDAARLVRHGRGPRAPQDDSEALGAARALVLRSQAAAATLPGTGTGLRDGDHRRGSRSDAAGWRMAVARERHGLIVAAFTRACVLALGFTVLALRSCRWRSSDGSACSSTMLWSGRSQADQLQPSSTFVDGFRAAPVRPSC
jgi:hypothetical protein